MYRATLSCIHLFQSMVAVADRAGIDAWSSVVLHPWLGVE